MDVGLHSGFSGRFCLGRERGGRLGLRVLLDRRKATGDTIHDLWPTAATYQRELKEMFGIDFPGSPRVNEEYSQQTYRDRPGRVTHDPREHMKKHLYPDPAPEGAK